MDSFFNNASVAAFLGAVFAVLAVAVNDWRRDRKMVKTIRQLIESARDLAKAKLQMVKRAQVAIREHNQVIPGEIIAFDVDVIREMKGRVLHLLEPGRSQALDAVLFRMKGADGVIVGTQDRADKLRDAGRDDPSRGDKVTDIAARLEDAAVNLRVLIEMADNYVEGKFEAITTMRYNSDDYRAERPGE